MRQTREQLQTHAPHRSHTQPNERPPASAHVRATNRTLSWGWCARATVPPHQRWRRPPSQSGAVLLLYHNCIKRVFFFFFLSCSSSIVLGGRGASAAEGAARAPFISMPGKTYFKKEGRPPFLFHHAYLVFPSSPQHTHSTQPWLSLLALSRPSACARPRARVRGDAICSRRWRERRQPQPSHQLEELRATFWRPLGA